METENRIKLNELDGTHVARSWARKVLFGLDKFKVVVMDYEHVPTIGQAFADEIYRVF